MPGAWHHSANSRLWDQQRQIISLIPPRIATPSALPRTVWPGSNRLPAPADPLLPPSHSEISSTLSPRLIPERGKPLPGRGEQSPDIAQHLSRLEPEHGQAMLEGSPQAGDPAAAPSQTATQTLAAGSVPDASNPLFPKRVLPYRGAADRESYPNQPRTTPATPPVSCTHQDKNSPLGWVGFSSECLFWLCITQIKSEKNPRS